jgi:hypothetical protein
MKHAISSEQRASTELESEGFIGGFTGTLVEWRNKHSSVTAFCDGFLLSFLAHGDNSSWFCRRLKSGVGFKKKKPTARSLQAVGWKLCCSC